MSIGLIKKTTTHYSLRIPVFDAPGWGREVERNFDVIDAVLFGISNFTNVSGVWTNGTAYAVLDRVIDASDNSIWSCLVSHTSASTGSFADDRAANPTYWELTTTTVVNRGAWTAATEYNTNDFVYFDNQFGVVPGSFTSSASFAADVAAGDIVVLIDLRSQLAAAQADADAAATSAGNAAGSASSAGNSATAAADSATLAGTHATTANTKAGEAAASATAADASEAAAATSATNAANSASASATSATNSANSATASDTSADASAASASAANTSATNSAASEALAEKWAEEAEDVQVETGKYSAKHHALKASASADAISAGTIGDYRNKVINGNFDVWQRGSVFTVPGYCADRWKLDTWGTGGSGTVQLAYKAASALSFGNRAVLVWDRSAGTTISRISQRIEGVNTLAGKTVTLAIRCYSTTPMNISTRVDQSFGTGGSPSAYVTGAAKVHALIGDGANPQTIFHVMTLSSVETKTLGTNNDDSVVVNIDSPETGAFGIRLIQVALVEGDVSGSDNPFPTMHYAQTLALCQRYYEVGQAHHGYSDVTTGTVVAQISYKVTKRALPTLTGSQSGTSFDTKTIEGMRAVRGASGSYIGTSWTADAEL